MLDHPVEFSERTRICDISPHQQICNECVVNAEHAATDCSLRTPDTYRVGGGQWSPEPIAGGARGQPSSRERGLMMDGFRRGTPTSKGDLYAGDLCDSGCRGHLGNGQHRHGGLVVSERAHSATPAFSVGQLFNNVDLLTDGRLDHQRFPWFRKV